MKKSFITPGPGSTFCPNIRRRQKSSLAGKISKTESSVWTYLFWLSINNLLNKVVPDQNVPPNLGLLSEYSKSY